MGCDERMVILTVACYGNTMSFPLLENLQKFTGGSLPDNQIYLPYRGCIASPFFFNSQQQKLGSERFGSTNGTPRYPSEIGLAPQRLEATRDLLGRDYERDGKDNLDVHQGVWQLHCNCCSFLRTLSIQAPA
jgi:hypothetical protein